jgi:hypothetical protein
MANTLEIFLNGNSKDLEAALSSAEKKLSAFGKQMKDVGQSMSLRLSAPLALLGGAAIKMATDFNESLNKVDVAFKGSSAEVQAFAKNTLKSFGIAEGTALDMAALFGDMATSMGLSTAESAKLSTSLVGLAGDLASFKNMNIAEVTTALNGIFTGETESLKRLGVVMTEDNLKSYALANGIKKLYSEMTQGEKVMLRYQFVTDATANAHGDFERTGGGAANQMRMMQEGLKQLGNEFGQVMLPTVVKVIKGINDYIGSISQSSDFNKKLIVIIGGVAAALGPLLYVVGLVSEKMISGFSAAQKVLKSMSAFLIANPYLALAAALAILGTAFVTYTGILNSTKTAEQEMSAVRDEASQNIAKEKSNLERLVGIAKNERVSKEERLKAIKAINATSPEYLKNITLDSINTDKAKTAIDKYNTALLQKATQQAAMSRIEQLAADNLDLQTGKTNANLDATTLLNWSLYQLTGNVKYLKNAGAQYAKGLDDQIKKNIELQAAIAKTAGIDLNKVNPIEEEVKKKTDPVEVSAEAKFDFGDLGSKIKDLNKEIFDDLQSVNKTITSEQESVLKKFMATQSSKGQEFGKLLKSWFSYDITNSEFFTSLQKLYGQVSNIATPFAIMEQGITASTVVLQEQLALQAEQFNIYMQAMDMLKNATQQVFQSIGNSIVNSFGLAKTGLEGFLGAMLNVLVQMGAMAIAESIFGKKKVATKYAESQANAITIGTNAAAASGPAGLATIAPFIAAAMGIVSGAFSAIPAFAKGGIVSGPTMGLMGEYMGAKSNPEVIAPLSRLQSMLDNGGGNNMNLSGEFVVRGQDLILALQRAEKTRNRIG